MENFKIREKRYIQEEDKIIDRLIDKKGVYTEDNEYFIYKDNINDIWYLADTKTGLNIMKGMSKTFIRLNIYNTEPIKELNENDYKIDLCRKQFSKEEKYKKLVKEYDNLIAINC